MRLYLDANVIIYAVEGKDESLRTAARAWLVEGSKSGAEFTTSMFTEFECHVGPLRDKDFALVEREDWPWATRSRHSCVSRPGSWFQSPSRCCAVRQ